MRVLREENMTVFNWLIKNVNMSPLLSGECIQSPTFSIDELGRFEYCLRFFPRGWDLECNDQRAHLMLCRCDDIPKSITLEYNLAMLTKLGSVTITCVCKFRDSQIQPFCEVCNEKSLSCSRDVIDEYLSVSCQILFSYVEDNDIEIIKQDLENLSSAYAALLVQDTFSDVSVRIGSKDFNIHKAIIEARSETIAKGLSELQTYSQQYPNDDVFKMLFYFLYSGKLENWNVSDELYILLEKLDNSLLTQLSTVQHIATGVETVCEVKNVTFHLNVPNFAYLKSHQNIFCTAPEELSCCWLKCTFIANNDDKGNSLLVIHRLFHNTNLFLRCDIYVVQNDPSLVKLCECEYLFQNEADWKIPIDFREVLQHKERFLQKGVLCLAIHIAVCKGEYSTKVTKSMFMQSTSHIKNLHRLSENFKKLFENPKYSDITIKVCEAEFRVHKAILSARSPVFKSMFQYDTLENQNSEVIIKDINSEVVSSLLCYMYCGKLNTIDFNLALDLYYAANKYQVDALQLKCSMFLKSSLSPNTAAITLQLADTHDDKYLKKSVCEYVCSNALDVIQSKEWKEVMKRHSHLSYEVLELVLSIIAENSNKDNHPNGNDSNILNLI